MLEALSHEVTHPLAPVQQVRIALCGFHPDMAEPADHLEPDTTREQFRCGAVPQIVEAQVFDPAAPDDLRPRFLDVLEGVWTRCWSRTRQAARV
jgi:hypothetical protein